MGTQWHCKSQPRKPTMLSGSILERAMLQQKKNTGSALREYTGDHRARTWRERNSRQREQCATDKRHQWARDTWRGGTVGGGGEPQAVLRAPSPRQCSRLPRPTLPAPRQHSLPSTVSQKRVFTLFIVCSSSNFNINSTWAGLFDVCFVPYFSLRAKIKLNSNSQYIHLLTECTFKPLQSHK